MYTAIDIVMYMCASQQQFSMTERWGSIMIDYSTGSSRFYLYVALMCDGVSCCAMVAKSVLVAG